MDVNGKKICVVGAGKSGVAVSVFLKEQGADVFLTERKDSIPADVEAQLVGAGVEYELGGHTPERLFSADFVVVSPGVSLDQPLLVEVKRRGIGIYGELEIASRFIKAPIIAITGTNGKSTTVSLVYKALRNAGFNVQKGGNIGTPLIEFAGQQYDWLVVEVSSFQLETIVDFRPHIAGVVNITPDHLDRHGDMRHYSEIKMRIFENQEEDDYAFINMDDKSSIRYLIRPKSRLFYFSQKRTLSKGVWLEDNMVVANLGHVRVEVIGRDEIPLIGPHNLENVMLAAGLSLSAGASADSVRRAIMDFKPLPHRMEFVREIKGVRFIDDSKGTNVDATVKALDSFTTPVILIAGGLGKEGGYGELARAISKRVKRLVLIGKDAPLIERAVRDVGFNDVVHANTLEDAVAIAYRSAESGDCVLLSPACASYDMFENYRERGRRFQEIVRGIESG